jgi:hypothetical protein
MASEIDRCISDTIDLEVGIKRHADWHIVKRSVATFTAAVRRSPIRA